MSWLKCSNKLICALQDLALCTNTERLVGMVRTRFPRLTGDARVQGHRICIVQIAGSVVHSHNPLI